MIPILTIEGPTAVGKSDFAFKLAQSLGSEIISADSRQIYRYLDIGTAKPSKLQQQKVKHHLVSLINPAETFSAGEFVRMSEEILKKICKKSILPIVVGGSGFYVKSLLQGLFFDDRSTKKVREEVKKLLDIRGKKYLFSLLKKHDPESAEQIHLNDVYRLSRALEIVLSMGKSRTTLKNEATEKSKYLPFRILVTMQRDKLYQRINNRVDLMFEKGLKEEVSGLLHAGYKWSDPGMNAVGYKEFREYYENQAELDTVIESIKKNSRNYAKRQFTWYKQIKFDIVIDVEDLDFEVIEKKIKFYFEQRNFRLFYH